MCVIGSTSVSVCRFVEYTQVIPLLEGYHESKNAQGTHPETCVNQYSSIRRFAQGSSGCARTGKRVSFELTFRLRHSGGFSWTAYRAIPPKEEDFVRKSGSLADRLGAFTTRNLKS